MKRILIFAAALMLMPTLVLAAGLGESAGHDLDALWQKAQARYDLSLEDAVILLDSRQVSFTAEGTVSTRIHRVVWIGTSVGIRAYADLRLPWNTTTAELTVEKLRTWREGRWWPDDTRLSDTAIVHTLPHAVDRADDYTTMRETMLLHDGVELGCIMETAYTLTEQNIPARGDLYVFPQTDPVVLAELRIMTPPGMSIQHSDLNDAPAPASLNPTKGSALAWSMEFVPALALPHTTDPQAYEPTVAWSSWSDWNALRQHWLDAFWAATQLDQQQQADFQAELNPTLSPRQKLAAVGEYLNTMVRRISYDDRHWTYAPRPASRTLATAYGHDLDRAVLAAALLQAAGFTVEPMFIGQGKTLVAPDTPRLADAGKIFLRVTDIQDCLLDPQTGTGVAYDQVFGHPFWYVRAVFGSQPHPPTLPQPDKGLTFAVDLSKDDAGAWQGHGHFQGTALFSNYSSFLAADDVAQAYPDRLIGSVLPGAQSDKVALTVLDQDHVSVQFTLAGYEPVADARDRVAIHLGAPADGLLARLPHDVHLYDAARQSPVLGVGGWQQTVVLRLEVEETDLAHIPSPVFLENPAGWFRLEVAQAEGFLTLTRTIKLAPGTVEPGTWPALRTLLLAEADLAHGLVIFK